MNVSKVQEFHRLWIVPRPIDFINLKFKMPDMDLYLDRLKNLQKQIKIKKFDAVLITSFENIIYLTGFSAFSKEERDAYLLISKDKAYLLTHSIYSQITKKEIPHFETIEISRRLTPVKVIKKLFKRNLKLGIEENNLTASEYKKLLKITFDIKDFNFSESRIIKTLGEIEFISKACQLGDKTFEFILKKLKVGVSEKEIAFLIDEFIRKNGAEISFRPIVAFNKHAAYPHHQSGDEKLSKEVGQLILLDFGAKINGYCSDMTRTVFLGKPKEEFKKMYEVVLKAQTLSADSITENKTAASVDKIARDYILKNNFPNMIHSLGHGIGLEVHEAPYLSPKSKNKLNHGMVFSIEPGIYIEGVGGVRIEDLYYLNNNKLERLTSSENRLVVI